LVYAQYSKEYVSNPWREAIEVVKPGILTKALKMFPILGGRLLKRSFMKILFFSTSFQSLEGGY